MLIITWGIIILGVFALMRILMGLIFANIHQIRQNKAKQGQHVVDYQPLVSVIIPAYNEEVTITGCVQSVLAQTYQNRQIIVVDDGSTDQTRKLLQKCLADITANNQLNELFDLEIPENERLIVLTQKNQGKSVALNHALKKYAKGELICVLDADSTFAPDSLAKMVAHFNDQRVVAMATNVRIAQPKGFLDIVQYVEYLLGSRLKGSEEVLNLQYIIGGIGSTFRQSSLAEVGYYDNDSITEDIDLSMKLLEHFGNRDYRFGYAGDVLVYTPAVHKFSQLFKQRYRWKYGRFYALFKHSKMIYSPKAQKYSLALSWWKLPKVFFEELIMLLDPLALAWLIYLMIKYFDTSMLITVALLYGFYMFITIFNEKMPTKQKIALVFLAPFAFTFLFVINIVDYVSLWRCLVHMKEIKHRTNQRANWVHVDR